MTWHYGDIVFKLFIRRSREPFKSSTMYTYLYIISLQFSLVMLACGNENQDKNNNNEFFFCTSDFRTVTPDSGIRSRGTVLDSCKFGIYWYILYILGVQYCTVYTGIYCSVIIGAFYTRYATVCCNRLRGTRTGK